MSDVLCIKTFERWGREGQATKLLDVVRDESASPVMRGEAAEYLGRCVNETVGPALVELLRHEKAFLREGAMLGIGRLLDGLASLYARVLLASEEDPSPGMRATAKDVVDAVKEDWLEHSSVGPSGASCEVGT
jgi:hypothetical protein